VAVLARLVHGLLPHQFASLVGEVIFAILLGLAIGNLLPLPAAVNPGVRFSLHSVLRVAIVLLGVRLAFTQVIATGAKALIMVVVLMAVALAVAHLFGRLAGIPRKLATLIGVGTAVCGNSAIIATAPVINAKDEEVSFAVATNTLFGTLAVFLYPLLGHALGLSDGVFGTWAGTAVNDTSQVVATGFAYSQAAGQVATVVKLTRNALMAFVIVGIGLLYARWGESGKTSVPFAKRIQQSVPLFVLGFLLMALLNTVGVFQWLAGLTGRNVTSDLTQVAVFLILMALAGVGLGTKAATVRNIGLKPFLIGLLTASSTSAVSILLISLLGPASG